MKAALYARRSTTEHQAASLDVQVEEARRWCAARGWEVVATYLEDGVSRAEFVNRPALGKLLAGAADGLFEALVMRDDSRLGGDMYRTGMVLQDLHDAGVAVWYYASSEKVSFDDPTAKLISAVKLYASETERLKITGRVREHLEHRARKGLNVGGRVYGYRNERGPDGVRYVVEPTEAAIVCEIFERHAQGQGIRGIAKALNARGSPGPRPGRPWAPGGIHAMLRRERYCGVLEWGRVGAEYRGGTRRTIERPTSERIRVERPELAIVSADLWQRAQARVVATAGTHTKRYGREPAYLLTGLGRCEACGGPIRAATGKSGKTMVRLYVCGRHHDSGATACPVSTRRRVELVDAAVLERVRAVLSPVVIDAVLEGVRQHIEAGDPGPDVERAQLVASVRRLEGEGARLADAYASQGGEAILSALKAREATLGEARARLAVLDAAARPAAPTWADVEAQLRAEVTDLRTALADDTARARAALKTLARGGELLFRSVDTGLRKTKGTAWEVRGFLVVPGSALLLATPMGHGQNGADYPLVAAA